MEVTEYIQRLLAHSGVEDAKISAEEDEKRLMIQIDVSDEDSGLLIGHHGETITALQRIVNYIFREELGEVRVHININDYRQRRKEKLVDQTDFAARRVVETGKSYTFRAFLPANERFIVHTALSEHELVEQLESVSEGEGAHRYLSIRLKSE